jgi:hypothetical protein
MVLQGYGVVSLAAVVSDERRTLEVMRTCRKRKRPRVYDRNVFKDVVDFIEEILGWVSESSGRDAAFQRTSRSLTVTSRV